MKELLQKIEKRMDDFTVKKKLYILYIFCVLLPLIITDSVVFLIIRNSEMEKQKHDMTNIANAVSYNISSVVNNAGEMAKTIYTSRYIDDFLSRKYDTSAQYIMEYQEFFKDTLLENLLGMNQIVFTMYTNNDTIVKGGKVGNIEDLKETQAYQKLNQSGETKGFFFVYDKNRSGTAEERKVVFLQKLDFFSGDQEKMLQLEFDYGNMMRTLQKMNFDNEVLICEENQIVLSNTKHGSTGSDFEELDDKIKKGYHQTVNLYGTELEVYVRRTGENAIANIAHDLPSILLLILINAILPFFFVHILNHSFTKRITELNEVFKSVDSEQLVPMRHEGGKDEIGSMIRSYNRMAARTNELIQTVYKNKLVEQEMLVSRKNAELLALHSQINPHFLFNALESIRMHSILKNENETADMVEKLAVMQRQYVEWGEDSVTIEQEVEFVKAYLALQKYRFGERLSYQIEIDEECRKRKVPKLTLVTFVENACVHGIESKASPGWIFVRVYEQNELICMEIEDTGNGMEEGKRQELLENMRNADIEMLKKKGRVGIVNACLRLKMVSENKVKIDLDGEGGSYGCRRLRPYRRGGGRRARPARGRRRCRGRPGANLRAACGAMPPCPGGARGHDGLRVAGACVLGSRRGDECRGADQSGHRVAAGNRLAVSGASVSARLTPCRHGGSDICGRDMKMAATVFRWRPSWRVFACCRLYAFLSARRS